MAPGAFFFWAGFCRRKTVPGGRAFRRLNRRSEEKSQMSCRQAFRRRCAAIAREAVGAVPATMFRPALAGRMIGASLLTNLVTGVIRASKAQYILPWRSYCPGRSRQRSGSAGAWTVPPGGSRFHQLALPNEEGARKKEGYGKDCYNIIKEGDCRYVFFSS